MWSPVASCGVCRVIGSLSSFRLSQAHLDGPDVGHRIFFGQFVLYLAAATPQGYPSIRWRSSLAGWLCGYRPIDAVNQAVAIENDMARPPAVYTPNPLQ